MSDQLGDLLLKAVRGLPPQEQDEVLRALLGTVVGGQPAASRAASAAVPGVPTVPALPDLRAVPARHAGLPGAAGLAPAEQETGVKVLPVRLPVPDYERLRAFSREHGFSMAVIIRTLVERFLDGQARRWASRRDEPDDELDEQVTAGHA